MMSGPKITYITRFKWKINHVTAVASSASPNSSLFSENFLINGTSATACLIFVHTNPNSQEFCSLFLKGTSADPNARGKAKYEFWIENKEHQRIGAQIEREYNPKRIGMVGVGHFALRSKIYLPSPFIRENTIIIKCVVKYAVDSSKKDENAKLIPSDKTINGCTLESNRLHFYVPRYLLIMQSNYFKRLLEEETPEARTGIIHIENIRNDTMKKFVYFMSMGTFFPTYDMFEELYALAYRYESDQLKAECKSKCLSSKKMGHLIDSLKLGFIYDDKDLKEHATYHLKKRYSPQTSLGYFETDEWIKFAATDLRLALKIKVAAYKSVGSLPMNYT